METPETAMPLPRALFIVNPTAGSGTGAARWEKCQLELQTAGFKPDYLLTRQPGEAEVLAKSNAEKYDVLVAVGGDGTNLEVANGLLRSPAPATPMAVFPLGTGNDLAETLGVPSHTVAIRKLVGGRAQEMDVLRIQCTKEGRTVVSHALVFAGVGMVGESLKWTTPTVKRLFGNRLAYPVGLLRALWSWRSPEMRVATADRVVQDRLLLVCASNVEQAGGGLKIAPGARSDDGLLNLNLIQAIGKVQAVRLLLRVRRGKHIPHPKIQYFTAAQVTVEANTPVPVAADGEVLGETPARIEVVQRGFKLWL
jgi:YegS/Rv2252/BmrU family lipid kinase